MNILKDYEGPMPTVKDVELQGLESVNPASFQVRIHCCDHVTGIYLDLYDGEHPEFQIKLDAEVPAGWIPDFLIDTKCVKDGRFDDVEDLWSYCATNAIVQFSNPRVILKREGSKLIATLKIGAFDSMGEIPLEKVTNFLKKKHKRKK